MNILLRYKWLLSTIAPKVNQFPQKIIVSVMQFVKWFSNLIFGSSQPAPVIPSLPDQLKQAKCEFFWAQNYYNTVTDPYLLDYAMYQMLAAQNKYNYLLKKARTEGVTQNLEKSSIIGVY
ncbi:Hypothetical protein LUCI_3931 [Lucifera butyrica]|uniref:DUF2508 family protein n=1 Tax=Lucifera butyrica TaxID=1351585 RepID=A0A498REY8_9FIRM|nr:DUF2508 family protein [Lucifera butyrica]VBB08653.1 Hypothetical protein LUCI_3931 [Lucifera butyrica]